MLRPHKPNRKKNRTYDENRRMIRYLLQVFWGRPADQLRKEDFHGEYVRKMRARGVTRNLNNELKLFKQILFHAYFEGYIRRPPSRIPRPNEPEVRGRELEHQEISSLFRHCADLTLYFQMEIAFSTGMRENELLSLHSSWIDYKHSVIRLPAKFTKGKRKPRAVPVTRYLLEKLRHWDCKESGHLFVNNYAEGMRRTVSKRKWDRLRESAKVDCDWHDWRHSYITALMRKGESEEKIKRVCGASKRVIRQIYTHLTERDLQSCADAIELEIIKKVS